MHRNISPRSSKSINKLPSRKPLIKRTKNVVKRAPKRCSTPCNSLTTLNHTTQHSFSTTPPMPTITFFLEGPGEYKKSITVPPGRSLRQVLQASKVEMLPSVCNGQLQCSTCHVKLPPRLYRAMGTPELAEMDILEIAADYDETASRLACQLRITGAYNNSTLTIPDNFINHMDDPTATPIPSRSLIFDDV